MVVDGQFAVESDEDVFAFAVSPVDSFAAKLRGEIFDAWPSCLTVQDLTPGQLPVQPLGPESNLRSFGHGLFLP
jgi:hypothetical protein